MHLYCMCQILIFNAINTIVTDMECNIRIYRLPLGRGTDQWKWYCTHLRTTTLGQSVYPDIALHIINYYTINYSLRSQYQDMRTSRLGTKGHWEWQVERSSYPGIDFLCSNQLFYNTEINWIRLLPCLLSLSYNFYSSNRVRK